MLGSQQRQKRVHRQLCAQSCKEDVHSLPWKDGLERGELPSSPCETRSGASLVVQWLRIREERWPGKERRKREQHLQSHKTVKGTVHVNSGVAKLPGLEHSRQGAAKRWRAGEMLCLVGGGRQQE